MPSIPFTGHYEDLSTDRGSQFKFYCGKCHNGYLSTFRKPAIGGMAATLKGASEEVSAIFRECGRCGNRVCEPVCWSRKANLCENCAGNR